ncbi:MAG: hypothetical protein GXO78_14075 [Calditrichaeota bacterium]|nr:hypothetical protein [Calditrichota bacterium]
MPARSQWTLRLALIYMVGGATLGAMMLIGKVHPPLAHWMNGLPLHIAWMVGGGFLQFVMGTAFWILPKFADRPSFYGNVFFFDTAVVALNVGLIVYSLAHGVAAFTFLKSWSWPLFAIALLAWMAHVFPRIKPFQGVEE